MPRLNDDTMESSQLPNTSFSYSRVRIDDLEATEYTLVTLVVDKSGSVHPFKTDMEACLKEIIKSCKYSPRADNLMVRLVTFEGSLEEVHGYKLLSNCNVDDYDNILSCGGCTALYDAAQTSIQATASYGKTLVDNDFSVNGVVYVITDGMDNASTFGTSQVKDTIEQAIKDEELDSINTILIGVGVDSSLNQYLTTVEKECNFNEYIALRDAKANTLAKLAQFVSKSISATSQSLGSGQAVSVSF
jgi:uncharacterized protein YegL